MERFGNFIHSLNAPLAMIFGQVLYSGINIFYKLAANDGMSLKVITAYRLMIASVVTIPLALILEWKSWKKLTWTTWFQSFLTGLLGGSLGLNLYIQSLVYTSATFASAIINLVPPFTFVLAVLFRMEALKFGTVAGKAKLLGILIGLGGALLLTLYKGAEINLWSTSINLLHHHHQVAALPRPSHPGSSTFILGAFLALLCCISLSLWTIAQAKLSVTFPYVLSSSALMCVMGSIQSVVITLCLEKDWSQWKLGWNIRLLTVVYTGVSYALMVFLTSWVLRSKGPLYATIFNPLMLIFVAILASSLLDEKLHIGSILGGILIISGLYVVLWGKAKEITWNTSEQTSKLRGHGSVDIATEAQASTDTTTPPEDGPVDIDVQKNIK